MPLAPEFHVKGLGVVGGTLEILPASWKEVSPKALKRSGLELVKVWQSKLRGPAGARRLGVGTGQLRRSIQLNKALSRGDRVVIGSDSSYAAVHEFGIDKTVSVREHTRRSFKKAKRLRRTRTGKLRLANATLFSGRHTVRAHERRMRMPKRPHREPALKQHADVHRLILQGAMEEALRLAKTNANRSRFFRKMALLDLKAQGKTGRRTYPRHR